MAIVQLDRPLTLLRQSAGQNDCGPHAAAMAIGFYSGAADPALITRQIWFLRLPAIGATLPWGITYALRQHGLRSSDGWFTSFTTLQARLAANRPVIVIVKPSDLARCPSYALHYRVAVGYYDDPNAPGGGWLFFNCSASPPRSPLASEPGNLTVDYATFRRQWRTYITVNWAVAVLPP